MTGYQRDGEGKALLNGGKDKFERDCRGIKVVNVEAAQPSLPVLPSCQQAPSR